MPKRGLNTGEQTGGEQGVTAQLEEIRRCVDRLDPKDFPPYLRKTGFQIVQWLQPSGFGLFLGTRQGQRPAVDLAVRQQWDDVKNNDIPRPHVTRQHRRNVRPEPFDDLLRDAWLCRHAARHRQKWRSRGTRFRR